ncbi:hypothetical protein Mapa_007177 [Marchantia paleacea]|nr:hypothetical protein Mapa_007177 [Marchantia paleacea]
MVAKRGTSLRVPFLILLTFAFVLVLSYVNFEHFPTSFQLPEYLQSATSSSSSSSASCNCSTGHGVLFDANGTAMEASASRPCDAEQTVKFVDRIVNVTVEVEKRVEIPVEKIVNVTVEVEKIVRVEVPVEKIVNVTVEVEKRVEVPVDRTVNVTVEKVVRVPVERFVDLKQWWAENKPWHNPGRFPLCSMDVCFNFSRCENMEQLLVYSYDKPIPPTRYFKGIELTPYHTSDPNKACLFLVFQDLNEPWRPHPNTLPHWNHGMNHMLVTFADLWSQRNPPPETIENASVISTALYETTYRPGFDIGVPLEGRAHAAHLQNLTAFQRKYLLTFRGTRYLGLAGEGVFRSDPSFKAMHNGRDVVVVTSCRQGTNDIMRKESPELGQGCDEDQVLYEHYNFFDLMNTTFSLAPAGRSASSYRLIESMSAGAIPVLIVDNAVKPFETLIQWHRCALQFPTGEMHRIVPALRGLSRGEVEERRKYCIWAYNEFLKDDATLLRSVMRALKARFFGAFAKFSQTLPHYPAHSRRRLQFLEGPHDEA